ncbi:MAG: hypothetical protein EBT92_06250 [Planctomycetes bacterium]|nr:hypothetical protein [Planctomycetota bacterium]
MPVTSWLRKIDPRLIVFSEGKTLLDQFLLDKNIFRNYSNITCQNPILGVINKVSPLMNQVHWRKWIVLAWCDLQKSRVRATGFSPDKGKFY